jgi:FKBP-type peptidyl-prolyl cis-trans isomerase
MKFKSIIAVMLLAVAISATAFAQKNSKQPQPAKIELKTSLDSLSYVIGAQFGKTLEIDSLYLNLDVLKQGMYDQLYLKKTVLTEEETNQIFEKLRTQLQQKQMAEQIRKSEENLAKGQKFLEENKTKPGVKVTPSGLQYKVITSGTGKTPTDNDKVKVHYHGTLIDGKVFDSSVQRGQPIEFGVNQVIKGWTEALKMMKEGDKWMLYIPADLAYGTRGAGSSIGPNETHIFEVELLQVIPGGGETK